MARVKAHAARTVDASPEKVLEALRDYRDARPRILTDNYTAYRVGKSIEGITQGTSNPINTEEEIGGGIGL